MHKNIRVQVGKVGAKKLGRKHRGSANSIKVAHVHLKRTMRLEVKLIGIFVLLVCHKVGNLVTHNVTVILQKRV